MVCQSQSVRVSLLALLAFSLQPMLAHAERIYRCPQLNAPPLFSGTPCASAHQMAPVISNGYQPLPLTPAEQRQLQLLSQKLDRQKNDRQQINRPSKAGLTTSATSACERHQEALYALQNRRRKGYKLSEAARLEQQEQGLRQNIRLHC